MYTRYSFARVLPGMIAAILFELVRRIVFVTFAVATLFRGSARNPRLLARFTASASVVPLERKSVCAIDSVIQPSIATRPAFPSVVAWSSCGVDQLLATVSQP